MVQSRRRRPESGAAEKMDSRIRGNDGETLVARGLVPRSEDCSYRWGIKNRFPPKGQIFQPHWRRLESGAAEKMGYRFCGNDDTETQPTGLKCKNAHSVSLLLPPKTRVEATIISRSEFS
jgi:hypothetical protein